MEARGWKILLDLGHGVLSRLLLWADVYQLGAVVLSHLHPDHVADLPALRVALRWGRRPPEAKGRVRVLGPAATPAYLAYVAGEEALEEFEFQAVREGETVELEGLRLSFARTDHPVETYAVRVEGHDGVLAYTADTAFAPSVAELARGADLLLAEATLQEKYRDRAAAVGHMTGSQAGELAQLAGARKLLLTHFFPTTDPEESCRAAQKAFAGVVEFAQEGRTYDV